MKLLQAYRKAKKEGYAAPLPLIFWRLIWFIPYKLSLALTCLITGLVWGKEAAIQLWREGS